MSHTEKGVANRSDPEPCEGSREAALEALDRGICRLGIPEVDELRNSESRVPTVSRNPEGNTAARENGVRRGSAESQTPCMHGNFMRENRETPLPSVAAGRRI